MKPILVLTIIHALAVSAIALGTLKFQRTPRKPDRPETILHGPAHDPPLELGLNHFK